MDTPRKKGRPISYSESYIDLSKTHQEPFILAPSPSMLSLEIESSPPSSPPSISSPILIAWIPFLHEWSLRFIFHLMLISLFETIFFWHFVSESEDAALITLVNHYAASTLSSCANLTDPQRALVTDFMDLFINQTQVNAAGAEAAANRSAYNYLLFRNSWLYFGGFLILFVSLAIVGHVRRYKIEWPAILGENLALVLFLGLYEWMYFSTVVLRYDAISFQELDQMIVGELEAVC